MGIESQIYSGTQTRTLSIGSLDGTLLEPIEIASFSAAEGEDIQDLYAWIDPQAAGIFGHSVVVWGREQQSFSIEAVRLSDAAIVPLVDLEAPVHVATADADLQQLFFITVEEESGTPIGLGTDDLGDRAGPSEIPYRFADRPVSYDFKYRLATTDDGSILAVQADDGPVTLINTASGSSREVDPGGPMVGFAEEALVAYGFRSDTGRPPLLLFDGSHARQTHAR